MSMCNEGCNIYAIYGDMGDTIYLIESHGELERGFMFNRHMELRKSFLFVSPFSAIRYIKEYIDIPIGPTEDIADWTLPELSKHLISYAVKKDCDCCPYIPNCYFWEKYWCNKYDEMKLPEYKGVGREELLSASINTVLCCSKEYIVHIFYNKFDGILKWVYLPVNYDIPEEYSGDEWAHIMSTNEYRSPEDIVKAICDACNA